MNATQCTAHCNDSQMFNFKGVREPQGFSFLRLQGAVTQPKQKE